MLSLLFNGRSDEDRSCAVLFSAKVIVNTGAMRLQTYHQQRSSIPFPLIILLPLRIRIPRLHTRTRNRPRLLSQISPHYTINRAHIMLRQAHVIQPRPPRPLLFPLHNLNALHVRTVHLDPHLHPNPRQLIS